MNEGKKQHWIDRLRPTAIVFAILMFVLAVVLVVFALGGDYGRAALGEEGQSAAVVTAALIVIGIAIGSLGTAMQELSKDYHPTVPEESHLQLLHLVADNRPRAESHGNYSDANTPPER